MKIIRAHPPNYERIRRAFPSAANFGVLFAYDGAIYNPDGVHIPDRLLAHEQVHLDRQAMITPDSWWDRYIQKEDFRLVEEAMAHEAEYRNVIVHEANRAERRAALSMIASRLSGSLYGNVVSNKTARKLVKGDPKEWEKLLS